MDFKVVFFGQGPSGKTSIISKALNNQFNDSPEMTIGCRYVESKKTGLYIFDTSGDERYRSLNAIISHDAKLGIYCIDLTKPVDTKSIKQELEDYKERNLGMNLIFVGTKCDLPDQQITKSQLDELARELGATSSFVTSAKRGDGVNELFAKIDELAEADDLLQKSTSAAMSEMELAISKLPADSALSVSMTALAQHLAALPLSRRNTIERAANTLVDALQLASNPSMKSKAIETFQRRCHFETMEKNILKAISVVAIVALVTLIAGMVGFGIGFACGSWAGPGAFISGVLAGGTTAAMAATYTSAALGLGAGIYSAHRLFKPAPVTELIADVASKAKKFDDSNLVVLTLK
jgi:small GTP-binding protein